MIGDDNQVKQALTNASNNQAPVVNQSSEEQQSNAYSNSKYTYDDAVLLADFWGKTTPWEAKLKIGRLLINNEAATIEQAIKHFLG